MSVKIMGLVWESALTRDKKYIMLAYADHADHNGENIFPSITLIAWKTGYSERQVQRITKELIKDGILESLGESQYGTNTYTVSLDLLPKRDPFYLKKRGRPKNGDILSLDGNNGDAMSKNGDILANNGDISDKNGDIAMSPDPSLTVIKPPLNPDPGEIASNGEDNTSIHGNLLNHFSEITCLPRPENSSLNTQSLWWEPIKHIAKLTDWSEEEARKIISKAVQEMDNRKLTISTPKSILKTAQAVYAKERRGTTAKSGMPGVFIGPENE